MFNMNIILQSLKIKALKLIKYFKVPIDSISN